jgi:hypothetical protein
MYPHPRALLAGQEAEGKILSLFEPAAEVITSELRASHHHRLRRGVSSRYCVGRTATRQRSAPAPPTRAHGF